MVGKTRGWGVPLGEWKLGRASAFLGSLARMASALKIKCPTLRLVENDWLKPFNKRQLVERNRAMLYFRSTTFNTLNGIFQHSTSHDTLFNICWTGVATFVAQQLLNHVSFALRCGKEENQHDGTQFEWCSDCLCSLLVVQWFSSILC